MSQHLIDLALAGRPTQHSHEEIAIGDFIYIPHGPHTYIVMKGHNGRDIWLFSPRESKRKNRQ